VDFVAICNVYVGKIIIKAAKMIFNSDKTCRSYSDLNSGVTFLEHGVECGPMPNVMAALPNIGGALCSTPQRLADAHY